MKTRLGISRQGLALRRFERRFLAGNWAIYRKNSYDYPTLANGIAAGSPASENSKAFGGVDIVCLGSSADEKPGTPEMTWHRTEPVWNIGSAFSYQAGPPARVLLPLPQAQGQYENIASGSGGGQATSRPAPTCGPLHLGGTQLLPDDFDRAAHDAPR